MKVRRVAYVEIEFVEQATAIHELDEPVEGCDRQGLYLATGLENVLSHDLTVQRNARTLVSDPHVKVLMLTTTGVIEP